MTRSMSISNFEISGFVFNANFDSGNLGRVELVRKREPTNDKTTESRASTPTPSNNAANSAPLNATANQDVTVSPPHTTSTGPTSATFHAPPDKPIDVEFNLWTRPDCFGTAYENQNRTWFNFSIKGGEKSQLVKFNVMNLNKQAKLFSQGMHPVIRHGNHGKWDRVKEKPTFYTTDENFIMSFVHKTGENVEHNLTFYAFTYPFTYTEQQDNLELYERKFGKQNEELDLIARELNVPKKDKLVIKINDKINFQQEFKGGNCSDSNDFETELVDKDDFYAMNENATDEVCFKEFVRASESKRSSTLIDENTSESMQQITNLVNNVKIELPGNSNELTCNMACTSKSFQQLEMKTRMDAIKDDIYYYNELLIHSYEGRRIDLVTITSFQGMQVTREERLKNLFPDYNKARCHTFKDKKIIFISSRVHPGETPASFVLNGLINLLLDRKNPAGIVLRRMYVFKIVPFLNPDGVYSGLYRSDSLGQNLNRMYLTPNVVTQSSIYAARKLIRFYHFGYDKPDDAPTQDVADSSDGSVTTNSSKVEETGPEIVEIEILSNNSTPEKEKKSNFNELNLPEPDIDMQENIHKSSSGEENSSRQQDLENSGPSDESTENKDPEKKLLNRPTNKFANIVKLKESIKPNLTKDKKVALPSSAGAPRRDSKTRPVLNAQGSVRGHHHHYKHHISQYNAEKQQALLQQQYFSQQPMPKTMNINFSLDFKSDDKGDKCSTMEDKSNLFLYLDLHAHASKKGVFMYGNHLSNTMEAVETMLLPKLMSMNSQHFDFNACNFSERNMYLKGKRDGLSKEGSGRVAIYKSTGLIKSYTLESNYNMGKCVNILPPKGKDQCGKVQTTINPPKFNIAIFEEVGRALGPSILDLTNSNPASRVLNSEYRTLQGLRNALKHEIDRGVSKARISKYTKKQNKRNNTTLLSSTVGQENIPSSSSSSHHAIANQRPSIKAAMSLNKIEKPPAQVVAQTKVLAGKIKHSKLQSFSKKDSVLASKDYHQNQVPRKKIKVSAASTSTVNNQPPSAVVKSADFAKADCLASTSTLAHASPFAESQTFTSFYVDVGMYGDDSMPGCSTSSKQDSFSYQKSPSPSSSDSCSSSVPASTSQMKITSFLPVKKHAKPKKMKFGKATSMGAKKSAKKLLKPIGNLTNSVNNLNSLNTISVNNVSTPAPDELELSVDETTVSTSIASVSLVGNSSRSSKLLKKKKRTLKTEVKRKKIRGKPLLH